MNKQVIASILFSVSAYQFSPALAQDEFPIQRVSYADLNLTTISGKKTLDARVRRAARQVCGSEDSDLGRLMSIKKCWKTALVRAQPQIMVAMAKAHGQLASNESQSVRLDIQR